MKKLIVISLFALSSSFFIPQYCGAQYVRPGDNISGPPPTQVTPPPNQPGDNFSIGGSFGLQFGTYTYVGLEPLMSYHLTKSLMFGIGPIYQYLSVNDPNFGYYSSSTYGGRIDVMYFLPDDFNRVFVIGEYDVINVPEPSLYTYQVLRGNIALPLLGIGYKEKVTDKLFFFIYGEWNFNNSPYNPLPNPVINAGFDLGLWRY